MKADIKDLAGYNKRMERSMYDKLFFVSVLAPNCFVDYGCADGSMIEALRNFYPDAILIGYDNDPKMIELAKNRVPTGKFTTDWNELQLWLSDIEGDKAIVLSSIIHEIYSYLSQKEIDIFWDRVFKFDYVIIRDMIPHPSIDRESDMNDVIKLINQKTEQVREFESVWGSIERNKNLIHFLLKYRYLDNWNRELRENYFPLYTEQLYKLIPTNYDVICHEHFAVPYLKNIVLEETRIMMHDNTHLKLILKKGK